ncbi:MAG: NTP transferase domain-containing protein [Deltaproteobacteria bacterium]|nr:NTP transferase domain-containing protein [Deltaproteobacteria bacterium]
MVQAVIIAAGKGNRLRKENGRLPKPLYSVAGLPIIERVILSAKKAGISEFVIVIGWAGERIQRWLEGRQKKLGVRLQFVVNPEWERANGFSLLKAKDHLRDDFVLLMSDHIFDWKILEDLLKRPPAPDEMTLGVDRRLEEIFDETDATKVRTEGDRIRVIGKEIGPYDAIDTGLFYCSPLFLKAVEKSCREGNGSISEAVQAMAATLAGCRHAGGPQRGREDSFSGGTKAGNGWICVVASQPKNFRSDFPHAHSAPRYPESDHLFIIFDWSALLLSHFAR